MSDNWDAMDLFDQVVKTQDSLKVIDEIKHQQAIADSTYTADSLATDKKLKLQGQKQQVIATNRQKTGPIIDTKHNQRISYAKSMYGRNLRKVADRSMKQWWKSMYKGDDHSVTNYWKMWADAPSVKANRNATKRRGGMSSYVSKYANASPEPWHVHPGIGSGSLFMGNPTPESLLEDLKYFDEQVKKSAKMKLDNNYMPWFAGLPIAAIWTSGHRVNYSKKEMDKRYQEAANMLIDWEHYKESIIRSYKGNRMTKGMDVNTEPFKELEAYYWKERDDNLTRAQAYYGEDKDISSLYKNRAPSKSVTEYGRGKNKLSTAEVTTEIEFLFDTDWGRSELDDKYDIMDQDVKDAHFKGDGSWNPDGSYKEHPGSGEYKKEDVQGPLGHTGKVEESLDTIQSETQMAGLYTDIMKSHGRPL